MRIVGLMSGTSLDGVDAAMLDTDGVSIAGFGPTAFEPFDDAARRQLIETTHGALAWNGDGPAPASIPAAEAVLHTAHLAVARRVIDAMEGVPDVVAFHGQTVLHRPDRGLSVQIGDAQALADALGLPVVANFRQADLAAGGQGAPLVPAYHAALAALIGVGRPVVFLNVGGVANLTWIGAAGELLAFDTGPGNGLIDQLVQSRDRGRYDADGAIAAAGRVHEEVVARFMESPFFAGDGTKSLDRYDFSIDPVAGLSLEDAAATLTDFTATAVARAAQALPDPPVLWIVCGGGRRNAALMAALSAKLGDCRSADEFGLRGDFVEAEMMAYLAARSERGLPFTYPGTTGVPRPATGGQRYNPTFAPLQGALA